MYSAEQVAEILGLHVRTVRGYIRDGRLPAMRVGKQYRIAEPDLRAFAGLATAAPPSSPRATVSTVAHVDNVSRLAMDRITTHLTAAAAGASARSEQLDLQSMYDEAACRLTVFVVGDPEPTAAVIHLISVLTRPDEQ